MLLNPPILGHSVLSDCYSSSGFGLPTGTVLACGAEGPNQSFFHRLDDSAKVQPQTEKNKQSLANWSKYTSPLQSNDVPSSHDCCFNFEFLELIHFTKFKSFKTVISGKYIQHLVISHISLTQYSYIFCQIFRFKGVGICGSPNALNFETIEWIQL